MSQDILITPGSGEPQILFRGSGTTDTAVELNVLSSYQSATGSGTALLFEGEEGLLFGVTDNLSSGTIFSVSDISGLTAIEYDASGDLKLGEYANSITLYADRGVYLASGIPATTTSAIYDSGGALHYNGAAVGGGGGISNVVEDTTPQLGGDLDAQTNKITFTDGNVTIGDTVTAASTAATGNVIIGQRAGATGLGRDNIAIGHQSLHATAGNNDIFNVGIGYNSLQNADGDYNVCLGTYAGQSAGGFYGGTQRRATKNICIGYYAGKDVLGNNNIEISPYNSTTSVLGNANYNDYLNIGHTIFADMANRRVNIGLIGSLSSWVLQSDAALYVRSESTTDISLLVEAKASQSASLQEWWDSSDTKLLAVGPDGGLELPSNTPSTTTNKLYNDGSKLNFDGATLPKSDPVAGASGIHNMMVMSQATYDALGTKDPNTLYYIV